MFFSAHRLLQKKTDFVKTSSVLSIRQTRLVIIKNIFSLIFYLNWMIK